MRTGRPGGSCDISAEIECRGIACHAPAAAVAKSIEISLCRGVSAQRTGCVFLTFLLRCSRARAWGFMLKILRYIVPALTVFWILPDGLEAAGFTILRQSSKESLELHLYADEQSGYLDLRELAETLGDSLRWERPGEKLVWNIAGHSLVFEERLVFFLGDGHPYQLVAPCRLDGGKFLVPLQLAVEYLPGLVSGRFVYNRLDSRLIDKAGVRGEPAAAGQEKKAAPPAAPKTTTADGKNFRISKVVIDPGHGGKDPGTTGRKYKLDEKNIVLEISKKVAGNLKASKKVEVLLTRDRDVFIPLRDRGKLANESGAGLFVSIHVNAAKNRRVGGSTTYFLDAAKTDQARATAMLENAALDYETEEQDKGRLDEVNLILQDMAQNEYLRESKDLSAFIQSELCGLKELDDRGLDQAGFAVLKGAFMPAALIETAYISNESDEKLLNSAKFKDKLAEAIASGILKYIEHYHKKLASGN